MLILDVINRFTTLVFTFAILQIGLPEFERSTARVKDFNALISELGIHCVLLCFIKNPNADDNRSHLHVLRICLNCNTVWHVDIFLSVSCFGCL